VVQTSTRSILHDAREHRVLHRHRDDRVVEPHQRLGRGAHEPSDAPDVAMRALHARGAGEALDERQLGLLYPAAAVSEIERAEIEARDERALGACELDARRLRERLQATGIELARTE